jgi:hypothetical protein
MAGMADFTGDFSRALSGWLGLVLIGKVRLSDFVFVPLQKNFSFAEEKLNLLFASR